MKNSVTMPALAAALVFGAINPAGASSGWVATGTKAVLVTNHMSLVGALPATTPLRVAVALRINRAAAQNYLNRIVTPSDSLYGRYLTPAQFTAAFSPSESSARTVASYLASAGLTNVTLSPNRQLITAVATPASIHRAFNTSLEVYRGAGQTFFANATDVEVPAALAGMVVGVSGINSLGKMHSNLKHQTLATLPQDPTRVAASNKGTGDNSSCTGIPPQGLYLNPAFFSQFGLPVPPVTGVTIPKLPVAVPVNPNLCLLANLGPIGYQRVYQARGTATAANTNIAVLAEGNLVPQVLPKDLRQFEKENNVPQVDYTVVPTAATSTLTDTSGQDEFDLDTQYSTGMAEQVKHLYVYDGPSLGDSDLENEVNAWTTDDIAKSASLSVGGCEFVEAVTGALEAYDDILIESAIQGQSLFVSSGDEGSACAIEANLGYPVGVQSVEFPASSQYVVAVGGTSLIPASNVSYSEEVSWIGGGGGISYFENAPIWQYNNNVPSAQLDHRGVPDIAMPADPNFGGASVVVDGADSGVGGTSLAAPLSNGVWARLESQHENKLGFAPPALYAVYAANYSMTSLPTNPEATSQVLGGFHDVYVGSNGLYSALPGYDYNTGLGSWDVEAMQKEIK